MEMRGSFEANRSFDQPANHARCKILGLRLFDGFYCFSYSSSIYITLSMCRDRIFQQRDDDFKTSIKFSRQQHGQLMTCATLSMINNLVLIIIHILTCSTPTPPPSVAAALI
jgi:hypothetical protein